MAGNRMNSKFAVARLFKAHLHQAGQRQAWIEPEEVTPTAVTPVLAASAGLAMVPADNF
jgi:hypothetical protein